MRNTLPLRGFVPGLNMIIRAHGNYAAAMARRRAGLHRNRRVSQEWGAGTTSTTDIDLPLVWPRPRPPIRVAGVRATSSSRCRDRWPGRAGP